MTRVRLLAWTQSAIALFDGQVDIMSVSCHEMKNEARSAPRKEKTEAKFQENQMRRRGSAAAFTR